MSDVSKSDLSGSGDGEAGAATDGALNSDVAILAAALRQDRAEAAIEARRLRQRTWRWRISAFVMFVVAMVALYGSWPQTGPGVARITIDGFIADDPKRDALLRSIAADANVKALIVRINSPGGTTVGGEALYQSIAAVAEQKPVVAVMGEVAASAGYIAALGADHIVARGNTITASIGVIFSSPNVHGALETLGVTVLEVASGEQKAEPASYAPVADANLDSIRVFVDDSFAWFLELVRDRRGLSAETMNQIRDGRILTGRMALELGLVDQIGGEREAISYLLEERDLARGLTIRDRTWSEERLGVLRVLLGDSATLDGVNAFAERWTGGPRLMSTAQ